MHLSREQLDSGLGPVREAPAESGELLSIVRRPEVERREALVRGRLDRDVGLVGDGWAERPSSPDGAPDPDAQVTIMSARAATLISGSDDPGRWAPAGDQLYVDLDLSEANVPAGTRLRIGEALLEVTAEPHLGCGKFSRRFGVEALKFVNSAIGRELHLRGVNARVLESGDVAVGDRVERLG
jgi:MOSC domain-containing protein YiiM